MSVFSALFDSKMKSFEQAFGVKDITSSAMRDAILDWYDLYYTADATDTEDPCQRLPVAVVSKLTKTVFSEYKAQVASTGRKSEWNSRVLVGLERRRKQAMQQALIGGECFLKPLLGASGVNFSVIQRRGYRVLGRNEQDAITDIGTQESTEQGGYFYTLLERRTIDENGYLTITSRLFKSSDKASIGVEVPLDTLPQYAALAPVNTLPVPLYSLGLIPVKCPAENTVDGSEDGVSVYAPAAELIHLINTNEKQINGEFERGESRIIVSSDLLTAKDENGRRKMQGHVFSGIDDDPDNVGVTIFSPAFREQSFLARKAEYLRNVETLIGLKRGILSEVEAAERTATEITSSAGDYNLTIIDFQGMWEGAVREAVRVCDLLGQMYGLCDSSAVDPDKDISISWGNGILYDEDKVWSQYQAMVAAGLLKPEIAVGWYFDMPTETDADLVKIREKYMPELEQMTSGGGDE